MSFVDPTGLREVKNQENSIKVEYETRENTKIVEPTYFKQTEFDNEFSFGAGIENTACNATAHLNELSEEYTKQTGKAMAHFQAMKVFQAAVDNDGMYASGSIKNTETFLNEGWKALGLEKTGKWSINAKGHEVYRTNRYNGPHYENSGINDKIFNTYSGKHEPLPADKSIVNTITFGFTPIQTKKPGIPILKPK